MERKIRIENGVQEVFIGVGLAVITAIGATAILAYAVINEMLYDTAIPVLCIVLISVFAGCFTSRKISMNDSVITPICVAAIYVCAQIVVGMLLFDGKVQAPILNCIAASVGCVLACVVQRKKRRVKPPAKKRYR